MVLAGGSGCGAAGGSMPMGLEPSSGACSEWRAREVEATPRRKWIEEWEEYNAGGMVGFLGGRLSAPGFYITPAGAIHRVSCGGMAAQQSCMVQKPTDERMGKEGKTLLMAGRIAGGSDRQWLHKKNWKEHRSHLEEEMWSRLSGPWPSFERIGKKGCGRIPAKGRRWVGAEQLTATVGNMATAPLCFGLCWGSF